MSISKILQLGAGEQTGQPAQPLIQVLTSAGFRLITIPLTPRKSWAPSGQNNSTFQKLITLAIKERYSFSNG